MARHSAAEIATGAAVLLVAGGFLVYALANTGQSFGRGGYSLHASFDHVDGLAPGGDVRIAGVKVGSVTSISLNPKTYQAEIAFTVQPDVSLTTDSSATIASDGLLGGKYVALATGGEDATLKPGGTITITQGSVNLEALIGKYIFGSADKGGDKPAPAPAQGGSTPPK
jgi:phospholipid/cholesterol/gamma-HCH transport system substrate-binding protein